MEIAELWTGVFLLLSFSSCDGWGRILKQPISRTPACSRYWLHNSPVHFLLYFSLNMHTKCYYCHIKMSIFTHTCTHKQKDGVKLTINICTVKFNFAQLWAFKQVISWGTGPVIQPSRITNQWIYLINIMS